MKVSIIIPAHNEEKRISKTLEEYGKFFKGLKNQKIIDFDILIVINNSFDKTEDIVRQFVKKYSEISYLNFKQGGKGFAIIEGFKHALKTKNDLIGFVDADMATPPESFYDLVKNINSFNGIIASRYMKGAVVNPKQSLSRIILSRVFNFFIRVLFLFPYKDTQCGAKLFKRKTIEEILQRLVVRGWAFDVDLLYQLKLAGLKIKEFPTIWSDKEYSKINFKKAVPLMLLSVIKLRILNSPFKELIK